METKLLILGKGDNIITMILDNLYYKDKEKTYNIDLLKRAHRIMNEFDISHYTSNELREKGYGNKIINNR